MRCGWGCEDGMLNGKTCVCSQGKQRYFPNKPKKKVNDLLPEAHKCGPEVQEYLQTVGNKEWFLCECGDIKKVEVK